MIQMTAKNASTVQPNFGAAPKRSPANTIASSRRAVQKVMDDKPPHDPRTTMGGKKTLPIEGEEAGAKKATAKESGEKGAAQTKKLSAAQEAAIAKKKEEAKANAANRAKTIFTFKSLPAKDVKIAPQALVVLEALRGLKKATLTELCDALAKGGRLKTVQTPERIVTFYRKAMEQAGYVVIS